MLIRIGCLSCGKHSRDEAESFLENKGSHCSYCAQDCLGFLDSANRSLYETMPRDQYIAIKASINISQKKLLIDGNTIEIHTSGDQKNEKNPIKGDNKIDSHPSVYIKGSAGSGMAYTTYTFSFPIEYTRKIIQEIKEKVKFQEGIEYIDELSLPNGSPMWYSVFRNSEKGYFFALDHATWRCIADIKKLAESYYNGEFDGQNTDTVYGGAMSIKDKANGLDYSITILSSTIHPIHFGFDRNIKNSSRSIDINKMLKYLCKESPQNAAYFSQTIEWSC